jgi:hypothetical protein
MSDPVTEAVAAGDLDELVRLVDRLCAAGDWDAVMTLRDRSRQAFARGHQLWPAGAHAEYRLALEAPGSWAGAVLVEGAGRFAVGPLTEVAASAHTWEELAPHIPNGPLLSLTAHERVIRGEDLTGDGRVDRHVLELPLRLTPWEPAYPLAVYRPGGAEFPAPPDPPMRSVEVWGEAGVPVGDPDACDALLAVVEPWVSESNGSADAVAVRGDAAAALAALDHDEVTLAPLRPADALARLAWAGASGGAHGRRRGSAVGRYSAWWALAGVGGLLDDWPVPADRLGELAEDLRWWQWSPPGASTGWRLHLAIEDARQGLAWAVSAVDHA